MNQRTFALIAVSIATLIYGVTYTIAKDVMPNYIKPYGFIVLRVSCATLIFWTVGLFTKQQKIEKSDYKKILIASFFGITINMLAFFKGLQFTTPINGSVIMVTTPIIVLVLSAFILGEKIRKIKVLGIFMGLSGALILSFYNPSTSSGDNVLLGNFLVLINAASYSYYLILIKKLTNKYHPYTFIKWLFLFGTFFVLPFGYTELAAVNWESFTPYIWFSIFFVVVCATFATYLLNPLALQKLSAITVSTFVYVQPVFAGIFAIMMGSDRLNAVKIVAAALIFLGVYLVSTNPTLQTTK